MTQPAWDLLFNLLFATLIAAVCAGMLWLIGIDPHTNAIATSFWFALTCYQLTHKEQ